MLKQTLSQRLQQKLSPQQIQLMKLIQLPTQSLEDRIQEELEINPALEEGLDAEEKKDEENLWEEEVNSEQESLEYDPVDDYLSDDETPDYKLQANNFSSDDELYSSPVIVSKDLSDILNDQLAMRSLSPKKEALCKYIIGTIEDDGYMRRELNDIVDDLAFSLGILVEESDLKEILEIVQSMDPPGVGARNLQECLLIQINQKPSSDIRKLMKRIVSELFEELSKRHYTKMIGILGIEEKDLKDAIEEISRLSPKPGNTGSFGGQSAQTIVPDYTIQLLDNKLELKLNGRNAPELNVSREYKEMLNHYKKSKSFRSEKEKEAFAFVKQKLEAAKWFVDAIKQRQQTLILTMSSIMRFQEEYFLSGDEKNLKPMILKDIADEIGMDISTISRVASNKYVQTPFGTFLIKKFFSESMLNSEGEEISTREIKKILEESISDEEKRSPLTDDALAKLLEEKGYPIARRTIAKYREQLNIPVARLRKML
ncbi:MAG: RNA polymerase sigma-54 factor [Owenweeksia sp. TMED14]|nr:MAG: RNA polymerase sigma-54 factor [Owenweeksia sp. TMED14]|tara:strand:+ start:22148 stop:23602 length:1455 start_codon:yes stop_codon:yes gene_type:complete